MKHKNVLAIVIGIAIGICIISITAVAAWYLLNQKTQFNILEHLPATQTTFVIKGTTSYNMTLPEEAKKIYESAPVNTEYQFGIQNADGSVTYAFATSTPISNQNLFHIPLNNLHLYASSPIPISNEPLAQSIATVLPKTAQGKWIFIQPELRKKLGILPLLETESPLLLTSEAIHILRNEESQQETYTFVTPNLLPNLTTVAFAGESLRFLPESERLLLISRLEYLWSHLTQNQNSTLESWLSSTESETVTIQIANDDTLVIAGFTKNNAELANQLKELENGRTSDIDWKEETHTLDSFTSSTIVLKENTEAQLTVLDNWNTITIHNTTYGQREGAWFISNIPAETVLNNIQNIQNTELRALAFGTTQRDSKNVLPIDFLPEELYGNWVVDISKNVYTLRLTR